MLLRFASSLLLLCLAAGQVRSRPVQYFPQIFISLMRAYLQPSNSTTMSTRACHLPGHTDYPFCNVSLTVEERVADLVSRIQPEEKAPLLTARESPLGGIPRLGLPEYDWGNC